MKNILLTIKDYEGVTVETPIVKKTIELASCCESKVQIIHVAPPLLQPPYNVDTEFFRQEIATELRREHVCLQKLANIMREMDVDARALLLHGSIINTILRESERLAADLVVMGRHKHGPLHGALMDDIDESFLAKCTCPIMFIPV